MIEIIETMKQGAFLFCIRRCFRLAENSTHRDSGAGNIDIHFIVLIRKGGFQMWIIGSAIAQSAGPDPGSNASGSIIDHICASGFSKIQLRSEEHTSELQSLMRISYAVFCLKKKKKKQLTLALVSHQ